MGFNGNGTFSAYTPGNPAVTGTTVSSTAFNNTINDLVVNGFGNTITRDGQSPATANIPMGNNRITGLAAGVASTDAANLAQMAASTGSSLVGFIQSGTGAVTKTVQAKLSESVSVLDFGAKGDGVTDDHLAIQAAINAVAIKGGTVFFPTGVYNLGTGSPALSVPSYVRLVGAATAYRGVDGYGVQFLYGGTGTAIYCQGQNIECSNWSLKGTAPSGTSMIAILHDGGWYGTYKRIVVKGFLPANGLAFKMTSGPVSYGAYECTLEQLDLEGQACSFIGRGSGDGITTLAIVNVSASNWTFSDAQGTIINGSSTSAATTTSFKFTNRSSFTMLGVDIEGAGSVGIDVSDTTCAVYEMGTIWDGWSGATRVLGTVKSRTYGPVSVQQTITAATPVMTQFVGGQALNNGVLTNFISDFIYPVNVIGGSQDAYRQWYRWNNGVNILDHDWKEHAIVRKTIATSAITAYTVLTVPVPASDGIRIAVHAHGAQVGDAPISSWRYGCMTNNAGTVSVGMSAQVNAGSPGTINFVASGTNVLVQWTPTTVNASNPNFNIEINGAWTSYS